jgi:hypothetical protein
MVLIPVLSYVAAESAWDPRGPICLGPRHLSLSLSLLLAHSLQEGGWQTHTAAAYCCCWPTPPATLFLGRFLRGAEAEELSFSGEEEELPAAAPTLP